MGVASGKSFQRAAWLLLGVAPSVWAGGFTVNECSVSGLGNAYAANASASDASTVFTNPAGMSYLLGTQTAVMVSAIRPTGSFAPNGTVSAPLQATGNTGGDIGGLNFVPAAYLTTQLSDTVHAGVGLSVPFGLQTNYDANWVGRFHALKSSIQTINLNPSLSWRAAETLTLGIGADYQQASGELSNMVNYSGLAGGALGANLQGVSTMSGRDSAWGYNLGAMWQASPQTRIGLAYRSAIQYRLNGTVSFSSVPAGMAADPRLANGAATLDLKMPDNWSLHMLHQLDERWELLADVTRTGWSSVQNLTVVRSNGTVLSNTPEHWRDTWRAALGANYHYGSGTTARIGLAYDQTPVSDAYRTARLPDQDRIWLALGVQYKLGEQRTLDVGYAHLFVKDARIADNRTATGAGNLAGTYSGLASNILGIQFNQGF